MTITDYVNLSSDEVKQLREADYAVGKLAELRASGRRPTFHWMRALFGNDKSIWNQLGRGTAVLTSTDQLDQYLYSYGLMVASQWSALAGALPKLPSPARLVDYGCGQGLAGVLLHDMTGDAFFGQLKRIVLIEPSPPALVRAEALYRCLAPTADIHCIRTRFDDLSGDDMWPDPAVPTVHIFSNVLDVQGFDQFQLFSNILTNGSHTVCVVSHDRDFGGGTQRIRDLKAAVEDPKHGPWLTVVTSDMAEFKCGGGGKFPAIRWIAQLDVSHE